MSTIDLNADVGEMDPDLDERIIAVVSSVNIACGGHAGDDESMSRVARLAAARRVRIGAHPSFVDREGFGRTHHHVHPAILTAQLRDQIQRLVDNSPVPVTYVKPHGALYHAAATDPEVARAVVTAAQGRAVMGQAGARYLRIASAEGIDTITEGFADRAYDDSGRLVPRGQPGAVLHEEHAVLAQVNGLAQGMIRSVSGRLIEVRAQSVCVHSDTPGAAELASRIARYLRSAGITVSS